MILVDWRDGATKPDYFRSVANTRMVGKQIGMLIEQLDAARRTHIIGFSLGAQIAGYAGLHLAQNPDSSTGDACNKLHRITGLDPAGPLYEDEDIDLRLDATDACYVDVIHTNAHSWTTGGLGIIQTCGHDDFYPNGGASQPGCDHIVIGIFDHSKALIENLLLFKTRVSLYLCSVWKWRSKYCL